MYDIQQLYYYIAVELRKVCQTKKICKICSLYCIAIELKKAWAYVKLFILFQCQTCLLYCIIVELKKAYAYVKHVYNIV